MRLEWRLVWMIKLTTSRTYRKLDNDVVALNSASPIAGRTAHICLYHPLKYKQASEYQYIDK